MLFTSKSPQFSNPITDPSNLSHWESGFIQTYYVDFKVYYLFLLQKESSIEIISQSLPILYSSLHLFNLSLIQHPPFVVQDIFLIVCAGNSPSRFCLSPEVCQLATVVLTMAMCCWWKEAKWGLRYHLRCQLHGLIWRMTPGPSGQSLDLLENLTDRHLNHLWLRV